MASLLDTMRQNGAALASPASSTSPLQGTVTGGDETARLANLTAVGRTGRDVGAAGQTARLSSLSEKLANANTLMGAQKLAAAGAAEGEQQQAAEQVVQAQQKQATAAITQQRVSMQEDFNTRLKGMLQDQNNSLAQLKLGDDKSKAEQTGFLVRLGNTEYIDKLQAEGQKARLNNEISFNEALQRSVFADEQSLFSTSLEFRTILSQDDRDALKSLSEMDLDFAMSVALAQNKQANTTTMWTGLGNVAGAGANAYAKSKPTPAAEPTTEASAPTTANPSGEATSGSGALGWEGP